MEKSWKVRFFGDLSHNRVAFPYQVQAFLTIKDLPYSAIFHEQGLGKTKIAIDLLLYWLSKKDIDTVMIVTKKQLVKNWADEFAVHTHIVPRILSSNRGNNFYVLNSPAKVIITNFETISTEKERISLFLKCRNVAIIIDESTKLKNPDAKLTQDFFALSELFKIKTIMTGTPVANRPYDLWAQVYFLDHGESLGTDFSEFKRKTDLSNRLSEDQEYRKDFEEILSTIYEKIGHFTVRETKASCKIDLPKKTYQTIFSDFEEKQKIMYETVLHELEIEVKQDANIILDDDSVALKRLLRLMQIASNPSLIDSSYDGIPGKKVQLEQLLHRICSAGDKCIVWSCFIENVNAFARDFACYNPRKIHGSMSIEDRNKSVDTFKKDSDCKVLFATPQAAKEGLTLTVANHVVFYDRGFNLDDYLQAQDRIHRISQKKPCFIYNIMMCNSVDIWIDRLIEAKHHAALLAQGDIPLSEYKKSADYSYGDLIRKILQPEEA